MYFLLLLIIAIPSFVSLLNPWYFSVHDFQHIARLFLLDQGIHQGYLFPRWVDVLGFNFGYPLFNFYPPFIYYISEMYRLIGASYIWSVKAMIISGYLLGAVGMYLLGLKVIRSKVVGLVTATLFTFFTYHAVLVYVRGAFAEFYGMNLLPFAFLSLELLREKATVRRAVFFGVIVALLIMSHVFVAFPFIFFCAIYVLGSSFYVSKRFKYVVYVALGGLLGALLSAFYWLPSMLERKFTLVDSILTKELASYSIHFIQPSQLWFSQWGYGGSGLGLTDGMSFQLGKIQIGLAVLSLILFLFLILKKKIDTKYAIRYAVYVAMLLFSLFMTTEYSRIIWDAIQPLQYLQFPWRFLTFAGIFISLLGGYSFEYIHEVLSSSRKRGSRNPINWIPDRVGNDRVIMFLSLIVITGTILQYQKYFKPENYVYKKDSELTSFNEIAWNVSSSSFEFSPRGVPLRKSQYDTSIFDISKYQVPKNPHKVIKGRASVQIVENSFNKKVFLLNAKRLSTFQLNTFHFPGWTGRIDGGVLPINDRNRFKLITVQVPKGEHSLEFRFEDTPIRTCANATSIVSVIGVVVLISAGKFKKGKA